MSKKPEPLSAEETTKLSIATLLDRAWPANQQGKTAAFQVRLPCGCVRTYALAAVEEDGTGCENAALFGSIDPSQVN